MQPSKHWAGWSGRGLSLVIGLMCWGLPLLDAQAEASADSSVIRWTRENERTVPSTTLVGPTTALKNRDKVWSVAFSPDGRSVVTGSEDGMAVIWDAESGKRLRTLKNDDRVWSVAFSPDGRSVDTGS